MKIAIIRRDTSLTRPDGINIAALSLASGLIRAGHDVQYFSAFAERPQDAKSQYFIQDWPKITVLRSVASRSRIECTLDWTTTGRKLVNSYKPDVIVSNGMLPFKFNSPEIAITHDLETAGRGPRLARTVLRRNKLRRVDVAAATCPEIAHELQAILGHPAPVIPNCIDLLGRQYQPLSKRQNTYVHIGTTAYKFPQASIRAFARAFPAGDEQLVLIGPMTNEAAQELRFLPKSVLERIRVTGFLNRDDFETALATARCVLVPSRYEVPVASPTVLESFAVGTPVVGSSVTSEILKDRFNGLVVQVNGDSMASAITMINDDKEWQMLSSGARSTAEQFSSDTIAPKVSGIISGLLH